MSGPIVCVDDQPEVRRLLAELFRARGREVMSFDNGEDAIAWLSNHEAELVVLDLDLGAGRRTGIEICRELRSRLPELPIIILTGHGTIDDAVIAVKAGAVDFITKDPYLEDKLAISVEKVERILEHARDRRRLEDENRELRATNEKLRRAVLHVPRRLDDGQRRRGRRQATAGALEQRRAELALQLRDVATQRGLGRAELARGRQQAARLHHRHEALHQGPVEPLRSVHARMHSSNQLLRNCRIALRGPCCGGRRLAGFPRGPSCPPQRQRPQRPQRPHQLQRPAP